MADYAGTSGDNVQDGTDDADTFDYSQGGNDTLHGLRGDDIFLMGAALTVEDTIVGGRGNDTLVLDGDYNISFTATTVFNIETIRLAAGHNYTINTAQETIIAGGLLTIDGSLLGADDALVVHGFAETDGRFDITGGLGNDVLVGGLQADKLSGRGGNDTIDGSDGDDILGGKDGNDTVYGGNGNDDIGGGDGDDFLYGGAGNDTIADLLGTNLIDGGAGVNMLTGGSGNDTIKATGSDTVNAGDGNDTIMFGINGAGGIATTLDAGDGDDSVTLSGSIMLTTLQGGTGADILTFGGTTTLAMAAFDVSSSGFETVSIEAASVKGDNNANTFDFSGFLVVGTSHSLTIDALEGDDVVTGTAFSDTLFGREGADQLFGGDGDDRLNGGDGTDHIEGGNGNDLIQSVDHGDVVSGGDGNDVILVVPSGAPAAISADDGNDDVRLDKLADYSNAIQGGAGHDTLSVQVNSFSHNFQHYYVNLTLNSVDFSAASTGFETIKFVPFITSVAYVIYIDATTASDHIDLTDMEFTGHGRVKSISGLEGDDVLAANHLRLYGGSGDDTLTSRHASIEGGDGNDVITLTRGDYASGGAGDDVLHVVRADYAQGGEGNDTIDIFDGTAYGSGGNDSLAGNSTSILFGGSGDDSLTSGAQLNGGTGTDILTGDGKANIFAYGTAADSTGTVRDIVNGFDTLNDKFDMSGAVAAIDAIVSSGPLSQATFNFDLMSAVDLAHLAAHHAVLFTPDSGDQAGKTFLIVDANNQAGYQADADYVIELKDAVNLDQLSTANFV